MTNSKIIRPLYLLLAACLALFIIAQPALAADPSLNEQLATIAHIAKEGQEAAQQNNLALMQAEYEEAHTAWEKIEEAVQDQNPTAYIELEGAMHEVNEALQTKKSGDIQLAFDHLMDEANQMATQFGDAPVKSEMKVNAATPADLLTELVAAQEALQTVNIDEAQNHLNQVIQLWPSVEGAIATRSPDAYSTFEINLGQASAALKTEPANLIAATIALKKLQTTLTPFVESQSYTMFDASAIILREGLEALLVIVALLAFLRRSGHSDQQVWVWVGGGLGVVVSLITAFMLQALFSQAAAGQNREVIEGVTGLVAAVMLFYVSYWLHSTANLTTWKNYIDTQTTQALQSGSITGLAFLAFIAVLREGAETAVFYLGMAPSISWQDLVMGLALGTAGLAVIAVLILGVGVQLPLRLFFQIAGLLVYYLGFKFLGTSLHALQVANILPTSPVISLPTIPFIGLYPTLETMLPQLLLLAASIALFIYLRSHQPTSQNQPLTSV